MYGHNEMGGWAFPPPPSLFFVQIVVIEVPSQEKGTGYTLAWMLHV